jgi:deoxyguanosine kinase
MSYRYIAVEGNIGAGKTSLATLLSQHYDARLILEEFADNTFLPKFYEEAERYAFPLELSFLADRYTQLKQLMVPDLFQQMIVTDYIFSKSNLFANINLKNSEYDLFQKIFNIINLQLPAPDVLIYLHAPIPVLQDRIQKRGRTYEQQISDDYLLHVQDIYMQYLKLHSGKILMVDTSHIDLINNPAHFQQLIDFLDTPADFKTHYLSVQ